MNITKEILISTLSKVSGGISKNQITEYSSAVLLEIKDGVLHAQTTNIDAYFEATTNEFQGELEKTCLPFQTLFESINKQPKDADLTLEIQEVKGEQGELVTMLVIERGKSKIELATLNAEHFPENKVFQGENVVKFSREDLKSAIKYTRGTIYANEARYNINGLLFDFQEEEKKINVVSTDGHRLAKFTIEDAELNCTGKITVPRKLVNDIFKELENASDEVVFYFSNNNLKIDFGNTIITTKLIDAEFPDYNRVIPKNHDKTLIINAKKFKDSVDRVSSVYLTITNEIGIRLKISQDRVEMTSVKDINKAYDEIDAEFHGGEMELMCNYVYLKEAIALISTNDVIISIADSKQPIIIKENEVDTRFLLVIMPMKI